MENCCTDILFATVTSNEGYNPAQIFFLSSFKALYGLKKEFYGSQALEDFIRDIGALYHIYKYNFKIQTGYVWKHIMRK